MKVLLLIDWDYPCDHRFLESVYAENFQKRGHDVTWVMRPPDRNQVGISSKKWNGSEVYVLPQHAFDVRTNPVHYALGNIERNPIFDTGIQFEDYDLVHVRNDLSMGLVAIHLKERFGLPFIHQISNLKAETLVEKYKKNYAGMPSFIKGKLGMQLRRHIAKSSDMVLPISNEMRNYLLGSGYSKDMGVLPTGAEINEDIPSGELFREEYEVTHPKFLLYVGSMKPIRNLGFLFRVLNGIDDPDVGLVMAGGRKESNRQKLAEKARERGVFSDVTFTGWISEDDMLHSAISAANIGVSPLPRNLIFETSAPIKTLEYLSFGTPVVASRIPDQEKVLTESGAGIATKYEVGAFVEAINKILYSDEDLGRKGQAYINEHRNFRYLTDMVEEYYSNVIN